jgi:uncharacterized SAM-binding protein YcdF (DUF218 family)
LNLPLGFTLKWKLEADLATTRRTPSRRVAVRRRRPTRFGLFLRLGLGVIGLVIAILAWAIVARATAPRVKGNRDHYDAIIILGTPADSDGNPTPELLDRVSEGVREYERGVAPRLIVSGAAAHNQFVEADVMARIARSQGVPASVILEEPQALDTIQNACYSVRLMEARGWHSAEVVSSASHLPRATMIFARLPVAFRVHAASPNLTSAAYSGAANAVEVLKTARYLIWARWVESCTV